MRVCDDHLMSPSLCCYNHIYYDSSHHYTQDTRSLVFLELNPLFGHRSAFRICFPCYLQSATFPMFKRPAEFTILILQEVAAIHCKCMLSPTASVRCHFCTVSLDLRLLHAYRWLSELYIPSTTPHHLPRYRPQTAVRHWKLALPSRWHQPQRLVSHCH